MDTSFIPDSKGKELKKTGRIYWLDLLKLIAIFMMVAGHCGDFVSPEDRALPWYQTWGTIYNSLMRPAIPLFVMVTGALLLPVRQELGAFYRKRIFRVLIPFLIWSTLYALFPWFTGLLGYPPETVNAFFPWAPNAQTFSASWGYIWKIPFTFSPFCVQMWYIYALVGLYLYLPVFSAWVRQASDRDQRIFLGIWGVTLFIPYLREWLGTSILGACSWNEFHMLYCFAGFNGYLLLGHYLIRHPLRCGWGKLAALALPMFAIGYGTTLAGFRHMVGQPNPTDAMVELFFTYCSPNVLLMTLPLALVAQKISYGNAAVKKLLASLSGCTFGIWMIHYILVYPSNCIVNLFGLHTMVTLVISSILVLLISWGIVALVKRAGKIGTWIMG